MDKDILMFLIITISLLVGGGLIIHYILQNSYVECTSEPFQYGVEKYEKQYGEKVYGNLYIGTNRYSFNSTAMVKEQPIIFLK